MCQALKFPSMLKPCVGQSSWKGVATCRLQSNEAVKLVCDHHQSKCLLAELLRRRRVLQAKLLQLPLTKYVMRSASTACRLQTYPE